MIEVARERHPVEMHEAEYLAADVSSLLLQEAPFEITRHDANVLERRFGDPREQIMALPVLSALTLLRAEDDP